MDSETCDFYDVGCFLDWVFEELNIFFVSIYGWITDGLLQLINLIPIPDFLANAPSYTLPSSIAFYANSLELSYGITIITAAYGLRFLLRRIPLIGG